MATHEGSSITRMTGTRKNTHLGLQTDPSLGPLVTCVLLGDRPHFWFCLLVCKTELQYLTIIGTSAFWCPPNPGEINGKQEIKPRPRRGFLSVPLSSCHNVGPKAPMWLKWNYGTKAFVFQNKPLAQFQGRAEFKRLPWDKPPQTFPVMSHTSIF